VSRRRKAQSLWENPSREAIVFFSSMGSVAKRLSLWVVGRERAPEGLPISLFCMQLMHTTPSGKR
jgi:hypothetical protein